MDYLRQFENLGHKQIAYQEGLTLLYQIQQDLNRNKASADAWGITAILANTFIIPLNIIVNAMELKSANSVYQSLVRMAYDRFGKSGTRVDGAAASILAEFKRIAVQELIKKGLKNSIPGVNIIIGLAEDSMALLQAMQQVDSGNREFSILINSLQVKISNTIHHINQLGIERARVYDKMKYISRIA